MGLLTRSELLKKEEVEVLKVDLGNDEFVYVRQMTGRERDRFERSLLKTKKNAKGEIVGSEDNLEDFRAKLVAHTVCNEKGDLLLQIEDIPILSQHMGFTKLDKIVEKAQELNRISEKDKEELTKNLEAGQPGDSSSSSVES